MSGGKLLCVLGLASGLLVGYAEVAGVVGPWMDGARSLSSRAGTSGRSAADLADDLGVAHDLNAAPALSVGRGVFAGYAGRVQRAGEGR